MRAMVILLSVCCAACDDAPAEPAPASVELAEPPESEPAAPEPAAPEPAAPETTTGFIEAEVDGELKRYEHMPARENMVLTRLTKMNGRASAESEEGFEIILLGWDVRAVELPMVFKHDMQAAVRGRDFAAAGRMPTVKYRDAEGTTYFRVVNDDSLECQSLEGLVLTCTFSGTLNERDGNRTVELKDGRLEISLTTDTVSDAFVEGTVGMMADESTEAVQEAIDRRTQMVN